MNTPVTLASVGGIMLIATVAKRQQEVFISLKFSKNGNFNYFAENVFVNYPHGQHKRCGIATFEFCN